MTIPDIKKGFGGKMKEKPEKISPQKEVKKDTSVFGGRKFISGEETRRTLSDPSLFSKYGLPEKKRKEYAERLTEFKKHGYFTEPQDVKDFKKELKKEKFGTSDISKRGEIDRMLKILKDRFGA